MHFHRAYRLRRNRMLQYAGPSALRRRVTARDIGMMLRALALARRAAASGEVPVGAVVYCQGAVLSEHANDREATGDPTGHAELVALAKAGKLRGKNSWRLSDCTLVVTLEPCAMCAGAIVNARIGRVIYGATDAKAGACESLYAIPADKRLNHRPPVVGGVLARACGRQLTQFFGKRRGERKRERSAERACPSAVQ